MKRCRLSVIALMLGMVVMVTGCASKQAKIQTARGRIDFEALAETNPEVFAWIYVPGADVDFPVLQSAESDTYYEDHDWQKNESESGSLYTEMANLMNLCDFNTIIHGKSVGEEAMLSGLYHFQEENFFNQNGQVYLYLPDNVLTYEVISCYTEERHSILRDYDLVDFRGCEQYIEDMQQLAQETGRYREGWEAVTPYHFLLSFVTDCPDDADKQYVVNAVLVKDVAGTIKRTVYEY